MLWRYRGVINHFCTKSCSSSSSTASPSTLYTLCTLCIVYTMHRFKHHLHCMISTNKNCIFFGTMIILFTNSVYFFINRTKGTQSKKNWLTRPYQPTNEKGSSSSSLLLLKLVSFDRHTLQYNILLRFSVCLFNISCLVFMRGYYYQSFMFIAIGSVYNKMIILLPAQKHDICFVRKSCQSVVTGR